MAQRICTVDDCVAVHLARGLCNRHYKQRLKPLRDDSEFVDGLPNRMWRKIEQQEQSGCWLWRGCVGRHTGYGRVSLNAVARDAHRAIYELLVGKVDPGLELDHLCRVRHCVNPAHLEPVMHRVNALRGTGTSATHAKKEHCPRGHAYDRIVTRSSGKTSRACRQCSRESSRRYLAKHRAQQ